MSRAGRGSPPIEYSLLLTATLCLIALGAVMVFSASSATSLLGESGDSAHYFKRTVLVALVGLVMMRLLSAGGLRAVRAVTPILLLGSLALLMAVLLPGVGLEANGARRWIAAGPFQVQPSEFAKLGLVLYGARLLARRPGTVADIRSMLPYLILVGLTCGLILLEPDLGTAIVAGVAVTAVLVAGGAKFRHLLLIGLVLGLVVLIAIAIEPYRRERLTSFLHPGADLTGAGFQGAQASIALGSGGLFGVGLGESVQKVFYLPESHTDMIAAVVGEEVGLLGITVLVGLFLILGYAGFRTAQRAPDRYGKLLAAGLTAMILSQAVVNLCAVTGLAPLTGVPLPFVSYGNSSLLVILASVGLILNIARRRSPAVARRRRPARRRAAKLRLVEGGGLGRKTTRTVRTLDQGRHSRRRHSRARRAGAGGRRRAAG